jgi:anti-sigma B factor antagonist
MVVVRMVKRRSPVSATSTGHGEFDIRKSWIDRIVVLSVCDAVDLLSAPRLTKAIGDALAKAPDGVIVDLTEVDFLASIGMSILVEALAQASAISARFGVVAEGAATSRPIKLLGLDAIVPLYATLDDALHDFRR